MVLYKGAGFGRYYCENDARLLGMEARSPDRPRSGDLLVRHIVDGTEGSPFLSLTKSYSVALSYARIGKRLATEHDPAVVYEITVEPGQLQLIDPVIEIAKKWQEEPGYHHSGSPLTLLGLVDPAHEHWLQYPVPNPPPGGAPRQGPRVPRELTAMVRAIRDAEILVVGSIPKKYITDRFIGWDNKWRLDRSWTAIKNLP